MSEWADFHVRANKKNADKTKNLSGLSNRELFELVCDVIIEQYGNRLDTEILEWHKANDTVNELSSSILSLLKEKEVPTPPNDLVETDEKNLKGTYCL